MKEVKELEFNNLSFKNFIIRLLQALKDVFKNILLFGKDKDIVVSQIKDCYENNLYNDSDILYIKIRLKKKK